jgi:hypothetical protein
VVKKVRREPENEPEKNLKIQSRSGFGTSQPFPLFAFKLKNLRHSNTSAIQTIPFKTFGHSNDFKSAPQKPPPFKQPPPLFSNLPTLLITRSPAFNMPPCE